MGALSIAFDITIVGALALSWVVLTVDLFFLGKEQGLLDALKSAAKEVQFAVLGVLLFAIAFFLGSAVSRVAQDFFNDDDLWVQFHLPRHLVIEDNIRIDAYCNSNARAVVELSLAKAPVIKDPLTKEQFEGLCDEYAGKPARPAKSSLDIQDLFHIQESAILLDGEDKTERLRQYHDQIMVLRGAAFNGFVAFALCLFSCSAKSRTLGWFPPFVFLAAAGISAYFHVATRQLMDPPFMEFTLAVLGGAGFYIFWKGACRKYGTALLFSVLITSMAFLGWWWTEALYDQQVIYSFYAQLNNLAK